MHFFSRVFLAGLSVALAAGALLKPRHGPRPRTATPKLEADHLMTGDGVRLTIASWVPEGEPRAVMLRVHSFGDHRQAFAKTAPWLAPRGLAFFAYDQRGFGKSPTRGEWAGAENLIRDLADAVAALRERHPGRPVVVLGESMGASVALAGLGRGDVSGVDGLILAAPGVRGDVPMRQLHDLALRLGDRVTLRVYPERHHLLLHEQNATEMLADCLKWLAERGCVRAA